jgi:CRISPR-associated protein Csb3
MSFRVQVDASNPGQFFGCCGLFELAFRMDPDATAHFEGSEFVVTCHPTLEGVLAALTACVQKQLEPDNNTSSPIELGLPFHLRLDWWQDDESGGRELKVWAGTMQSVRIVAAMVAALRADAFRGPNLFDVGQVVFDRDEPSKKVEPFYFDARRAPNAHSRDVGFSPNDLDLTTTAFPATEALCLIGLQRFRPMPTDARRVYDYFAWGAPLRVDVAAGAACGVFKVANSRGFRFENWFRTGQRKHKAFRRAVSIEEGK